MSKNYKMSTNILCYVKKTENYAIAYFTDDLAKISYRHCLYEIYDRAQAPSYYTELLAISFHRLNIDGIYLDHDYETHSPNFLVNTFLIGQLPWMIFCRNLHNNKECEYLSLLAGTTFETVIEQLKEWNLPYQMINSDYDEIEFT